IYAAGMSNGSFLCYLLACQSDRFAAIGAVTGSMGRKMFNACKPLRPVPVIQISGTKDNLNPYKGNSGSKAIEDVIEFWVKQNQCDPVPQISTVPDVEFNDGATAEHHIYSNGINGSTVELFKVFGG